MAALGVALAAAPSLAKKCSGCGPKVKACKTAVKTSFDCKSKTGKDKKTCIKNQNKAIKSDCVKKTCLNANPCSPSGAFVD
ncbi:MAG TPA: hypothetical protein VKW76_07640 [Candidatus Binatia bacterium]|nr:hypothetical protein [Candidatus Binatia bacterium]